MAQLEQFSRKKNVVVQADSKSARDIGLTIQDLQKDLDRDRDRRLREKAWRKERRAFDKLPEYAPRMEFWCDRCAIDFVAPAHKQWLETHRLGTWQSFCPVCEGWVYRHITAKLADPYYQRSEKVRSLRGVHADDMVQPGQYGFRTLYGDPFEEHYRRFQLRHEELWNKYAAMGLAGRTIAQAEDEEELDEEDFES